ncbi:MAG: hypothetical protein ACK4SN_10125, partial [Bellilinea sp.]
MDPDRCFSTDSRCGA